MGSVGLFIHISSYSPVIPLWNLFSGPFYSCVISSISFLLPHSLLILIEPHSAKPQIPNQLNSTISSPHISSSLISSISLIFCLVRSNLNCLIPIPVLLITLNPSVLSFHLSPPQSPLSSASLLSQSCPRQLSVSLLFSLSFSFSNFLFSVCRPFVCAINSFFSHSFITVKSRIATKRVVARS